MGKLRQLQLDNYDLPFLFLSEGGKPMVMDTARKINLYEQTFSSK
jgi:hypothetical protein